MYGFYSQILVVDLTDQGFAVETVDEEILQAFLGGKGLGSYLLSEFNPPQIDPFSPENHVVFATGPACGSFVWGSSRYGVFTKSPQTGLYSESYSGGRVPEAIDATGYDALIIKGRSPVPTVLAIRPGEVVFHEAGDIWGMDTYQAEDEVIRRFAGSASGKAKKGAIVIGPAGENHVCFSVIENDYWRSAGRTGVGCVLGSKRLKAILFQGDCSRKLADRKAISVFSKGLAKEAKDNAQVAAYKNKGTPMMVKIMNEAGGFPTRYWSEGIYDKWQSISSDALHKQCDVRPRACLKCFMACGRLSTVKCGRHAGLKIEGPEYETIYAFGGLCAIDSIEEIMYLNDICDRLGMDTISAGNLCGLAIEAVRRGKIDYDLDYGDVDAIAGLLKEIAYRRGIGDLLARGIRIAAGQWELEEIAVHVKGLEPAGYDPRVLKGVGLGYATSDRGACHLRATFYKPELSGMIDPDAIEGKAALFVDFEDRLTLFDTLILCRFYRDLYPWESLCEVVEGLTGLRVNTVDLKAISSRISDTIRDFNIQEGLRPEDDRLPERLLKNALKGGHRITEGELEKMVSEYYHLRGWDDRGYPQ
ncbi:MAG: aldehyde:ferredoxin oxidoreductase [Desulfobacterales bacterium S7086C20]|nr:aldehyde ferredoxin oxidoreductase family protein [Deltaproteobacteria bacterium]OEU45646.1 MAG: aldehyde:ferredoxin oxidoreductase [Desulfobacterales bacterium S7086C20]